MEPLSRYTLMGVYTDIHRDLVKSGIQPRELLGEKNKISPNHPQAHDIFEFHLQSFSFEEKVYLRSLNDQQRYFLGDDLMQVAIALNEKLPKFKDLDQEEKLNYKEVVKFPPKTVVTAKELLFDYFKHESPSYLRRLMKSLIITNEYVMNHSYLSDKDIELMESISADWLLSREKTDKEILSILSMTDSHGKPMEMKDTDVPRFKFIYEVMPSLIAVSSFKRGESSNFAKFINRLPSLLTWVLGSNKNNLTPSQEDPIMDILETTMTFTRAFQANADKAARLRQMIHYGFPVYKELIDLTKSHNSLMSWNFESIIYRLSCNIKTILSNREIEEPLLKFFTMTGILDQYAIHKGCYIEK